MVTTIPWGDGSGDNIYLEYLTSEGNQTVSVTSDANSGGDARSKNVTFSASGVSPVSLSVSQEAGQVIPGGDGRIWAYYDVTTTSTTTQLLYSTTGFSNMIVDGVQTSISTSFQFSTTGEHLVKFTLNGNTTGIAQNQFFQITRLTKIVTPSAIISIGQRSFYGCTGLTAIDLPGVKTIAYQCFQGDTALTGELNLPSLTTLSPSGNVGAEFNNTRITSISSLGSLTATQNQSFGSNSSLTSVILPATLTMLAQWTFYNCSGLTTVTCYATTPPSFDRAFQGCSQLGAIYVPSGSVTAYKAANGWKNYSSIISGI